MLHKLTVFSGIQPTGILTIGNYIGALSQWEILQKKYLCIYCIADLHSLTVIKNIHNVNKNILDTLSILLACGINPEKSIIFAQSHVPQHTQLHWILNCFTKFGELNRMTQFKEKYHCNNTNAVALFNYPILMAADILLYGAHKVPVGKDQIQHLELTRTLAKRFNNIYGNVFITPEIILNQHGSCIMSLSNPTKKMSKTDINTNNIISLLDNTTSIIYKIKHAITDSDKPPVIKYDLINKPGISNLLNILSHITNTSISKLEKKFYGQTYYFFKEYIIEHLNYFLNKLREKYYFYRQDENYLNNILKYGSEKANEKALVILNKIYHKLGLK
ncbi:tryptophan--tRNA ligase [Enterobacteriaceae endosymbiont of Macroplea appendiculata]|uniref:tryptophan--tRNA ligase n=1 Tax=Enterobacteriaceae endosymbiont of Macroplea appendiculata TaxID=2675790 RepID=UPI001449B399|nr:tryptophan--tRNA ligase [Enterobacteriaceae endosymbiont of Macroplea appendiculata]QJC30946.1 tryptophan--tRNA ligase [Enterobacteriaceae endosymbiont of Macroplea appendiculata]